MVYSYPQFRKNTTGTSYYQITSEHHLVEWQKLGGKLLRHEIEARILPEKLLIADILACVNNHYLHADESEWDRFVRSEGKSNS
jgi:hypothetical protein